VDLASGTQVTVIEPIDEASGLSFAYQDAQSTLRTAKCGAASFAFSRTVPLADLYETSDDKVGLQQLTAVANNLEFTRGAVKYDIWLDEETGASIAVPAGRPLVPSGDGQCVVNVSQEVQMRVTATNVPSPWDYVRQQQVEAAANAFTWSVFYQFEEQPFPDPGFTYPTPLLRPDGFVARRWAYARNAPGDTIGEMKSEYLFITNMALGNRFYGVAALRRNFFVNIPTSQACAVQPSGQGCAALVERFKDWSASAVAVHLATIPPR
jgi:hypothetical protein